jgi:hypothetical protein
MKRPGMFVLVAGLMLMAGSCKEGPMAGELSVDLTTPNSDDGAIAFTAAATSASGETITSVSTPGCSGCKVFVSKVSETQYKGIVTGTISAGTLFKLGVSNTKKPESYSVVINSVASRTFAIRSTSGYAVTLK